MLIMIIVIGIAIAFIRLIQDLLKWKHSLIDYTIKAKESLKKPGSSNEKMKTKEDLKNIWTIKNKRYSLNSFVDSHPGGESAILLGKGTNCTELFEAYHSLVSKSKVLKVLSQHVSSMPDAVMGDYDYDHTFNWNNTPFTDTLNKRVKNYFIDNNISHKASYFKVIYLIFFTLLSIYCLMGFFKGSWLSMIILPFAYWLGPSTMMHDGNYYIYIFFLTFFLSWLYIVFVFSIKIKKKKQVLISRSLIIYG